MLRVALTGPESTGKTTLSRQLAEHYRTTWAPEFAREYLEAHGPGYTLADLELIAQGQVAAEEEAARHAHRVVFCDTDLLVIKVWSEHAFGECPEWVKQRMQQQQYDLILLLGIDIPWEADPLREHPNHRQYFYSIYHAELSSQMSNFVEIRGTPSERLEQACFFVDALLAEAGAATSAAAPR